MFGVVYSGLDTGFAISPVVFGVLMDRGQYGATLLGAAAVLLLSVVAALGVGSGVSKSEVSRICADLDVHNLTCHVYAPLRRLLKGPRMYRVTVLYENEPDEQEYAAHAEMCRCVPDSAFRHGKVTGSPMGEAPHAYYAEWEFADKAAFDAGHLSMNPKTTVSAPAAADPGAAAGDTGRGSSSSRIAGIGGSAVARRAASSFSPMARRRSSRSASRYCAWPSLWVSWCEQNRTALCDQKRNNAVPLLPSEICPVASSVASAEDRALRGRNPTRDNSAEGVPMALWSPRVTLVAEVLVALRLQPAAQLGDHAQLIGEGREAEKCGWRRAYPLFRRPAAIPLILR